MAIYDFVGLMLGHFGPMFGPATYWVSWRAICWAYLGPSGHIGSFQGYVGPIYLGSCAGVLGHLEGYVEILEGYKAICGYFEPSVLELERSVCLRPFFLHGSSIFEFLVLCCMQPLGCVMCKKHCKYRETFGSM